MKLNEFADEVHETAVNKGWYDNGGPQPLERMMMIVGEISEAHECVRNKEKSFWVKDHDVYTFISDYKPEDGKPEGEAVEFADAMIRIADVFAHRGWNLEQVLRAKMDYNKTREYKHGEKLM